MIKNYGDKQQTWRLGDLSCGLKTSRDQFLQVLVSVLVLDPQSLGLGLGTLESRSRSWSWNIRVLVLVLVLNPSSLGLGLGLGTWGQWQVHRAASIAKKSYVCLSPLLLWERYLATVVCCCGQMWLEWVTTCCHSWSTCDGTISCKISCSCTAVISL